MVWDLTHLRAMLPFTPKVPVTFLSLRTPVDMDGLLPPLTDFDTCSSDWWRVREQSKGRVRRERGEGGEEKGKLDEHDNAIIKYNEW